MKIRTGLLAIVATFLLTASGLAEGTANITNIIAYPDGDGAIICPDYSWQNTSVANIYGDQKRGPAHILFHVATDLEDDPTLTLNNVIDNDTGFAWAGYQVNVYMNKPFTIGSAPLLNTPAGWSLLSYSPVAVNTGTNWFGQIEFAGTPDIAPADQIDFTYALTFVGSVNFTAEFIPVAAVPEPASAGLVLMGGLLIRLLARRQRS